MKKRKKVFKIVSIISAIMILIIFTSVIIYMKSKKLKVEFFENIEVDVNKEINNYQFVKTLKNGKILTEKANIDTTSLGKKTVYLTIKPTYGKEKVFNYSILVVDKESPKITFKNTIETYVGSKVNLLKGVTVTDNSNEEIEVIVEGTYDFNVEGEYKLKYVAFDSSGNKAEEDFVLKVKKRPTTSTPNNQALTFTTPKGFSGVIKNGVTYIDGYLIANKTYSLPKSYGSGLTNEMNSAFKSMKTAANNDGINIFIVSGFRSYSTQNNLYNNYVKHDGKEKADTYSARPGHSEHQAGLAADFNTANSSDHFENSQEYAWLQGNSYKFGFILRYPKGKINETGYKYEPWHYRYVGVELATKLYNDGDWITLEDYFGITSEYK